jgi:hypothetical protein
MLALTGVSGNRVFWSVNADDSVGCLSGRFSGTTGWQIVNRSLRMEGHEISALYRPFHPQDWQLGAAETLGLQPFGLYAGSQILRDASSGPTLARRLMFSRVSTLRTCDCRLRAL